jgi:hypothetical protein
MAAQNVTNGNLVDGMPQVGQSTLEEAVPPRRVVLRHANDELFNLFIDAWTPRAVPILATVELTRN